MLCSPGEVLRAYSLIELLVGIAISANLAGLMWPALATAKEQGSRTQDINNNQQPGLAMTLYAGYNNGRMRWPKGAKTSPERRILIKDADFWLSTGGNLRWGWPGSIRHNQEWSLVDQD